MPTLVVVLLAALVVALLAWMAWVSLQSLLQARALFRLAGLRGAIPDGRGCLAAYGRVSVTRRLAPPIGGHVLWCRTEQQVWRRRGKSSGWSTVSTEDEIAGFSIDVHGLAVYASELPTEVQGTSSQTVVHERTGLFGWGHSHGDRRTVYTYLVETDFVSLLGRLEGEAGLARDNKLGLLLSPHEPGKAAWVETAKGLAGLLGITALVGGALWLYYNRFA